MDGQLSFATLDYVGKKKRTRRRVSSGDGGVGAVVIAPHYPKEGPQGGAALWRNAISVVRPWVI
jgi:hypothetical protein